MKKCGDQIKYRELTQFEIQNFDYTIPVYFKTTDYDTLDEKMMKYQMKEYIGTNVGGSIQLLV